MNFFLVIFLKEKDFFKFILKNYYFKLQKYIEIINLIIYSLISLTIIFILNLRHLKEPHWYLFILFNLIFYLILNYYLRIFSLFLKEVHQSFHLIFYLEYLVYKLILKFKKFIFHLKLKLFLKFNTFKIYLKVI